MPGNFNVHVWRDGGAYVADFAIPLRNGKFARGRLKCNVRDAARELGYDPAELGALFDPKDPEHWWRVVESADDSLDDLTNIGAVERDLAVVELSGKIGRRIKKRFKKFGKRIGAAFRRFAKSKLIRGIVRIGKKIIKNPIFTGIASALTGGMAAPLLMGATAAVNIIDVAKNAKKKRHKKAARKLMKLTLATEKQDRLEKLGKLPAKVKAKGKLKDGMWEGVYATPAEEKKMDELMRVVGQARRERKLEQAVARKAMPIRAEVMPPVGDTQRWLVQLGGLQTW